MTKPSILKIITFKNQNSAWLSPITKKTLIQLRFGVVLACLLIALIVTAIDYGFGIVYLRIYDVVGRSTLLFILVGIERLVIIFLYIWVLLALLKLFDLVVMPLNWFAKFDSVRYAELELIIRPLCAEQGFLLKIQVSAAERTRIENNFKSDVENVKSHWGL